MSNLYKSNPIYRSIFMFCKYRKISIADMCRGADISPGIITDIKMGRKKTIQTETAIKISTVLKIPVELLYNCQYYFGHWDVDTTLMWHDSDTDEDKLHLLKEHGVDELYLDEACTLIIAEAVKNLAHAEVSPQPTRDSVAESVMRLFNTDNPYIEKAAQTAAHFTQEKFHGKGYSFSEEEEKLIRSFNKLNAEGQQKAVERVEELTEIPKYQRTEDK